MHAVYEGDVRFEQCMALDVQPQIEPRLQRACWSEWVAFYTYGQTRDRVAHAQLRIRQLSGAEPARADGAGEHASEAPLSGPEPITAMASPPATMSEEGSDSDRCALACRVEHDDCSRDCASPLRPPQAQCREDCSVGFASCVAGCG